MCCVSSILIDIVYVHRKLTKTFTANLFENCLQFNECTNKLGDNMHGI